MNYLSAVRMGTRLAVLLCFLLVGAFSTRASIDYTYTGQPFTDFNLIAPCPASPVCNISGTLGLDVLLPANGFFAISSVNGFSQVNVLSGITVISGTVLGDDVGTFIGAVSFYDFTDGVTDLNENNSDGDFLVGTDSSGHIDEWFAFLSQGTQGDSFILCFQSLSIPCDDLTSLPTAFDQATLDLSEGNPPHDILVDAFNNSAPGMWMGGGLPQNGNGGGNGNGNGPAPTPEPGAFSLLLIGATLLLGASRFRKMAHAPAVR